MYSLIRSFFLPARGQYTKVQICGATFYNPKPQSRVRFRRFDHRMSKHTMNFYQIYFFSRGTFRALCACFSVVEISLGRKVNSFKYRLFLACLVLCNLREKARSIATVACTSGHRCKNLIKGNWYRYLKRARRVTYILFLC